MKEQRKKSGLRSILAALLLLAMLLAAVSCGKEEEGGTPSGGTTGDGGSSTGEVTTEDQYNIPDAVGDRDYENATIRIASSGRSWYDDEVTVARPTGDIIDDAVYKRNKAVEARLNISITNKTTGTSQYEVSNQLRQDKLNGMDNIDIAWNPVYSTIMYTSEGILSNLLAVPNLDLGAGYWSQLFNESVSIGNAQYMAAGPISLSYYRFVFVTYVNKTLLNSHDDAPDLVEAVKGGKWTLDYQYELAKQYYRDTDGIAHNEQDVYGFVSSPYLNVDPYWSSCEISILTKNDDNYYEYNLSKERLSTTVDKILQFFYDEDATYLYKLDVDEATGNAEQDRIAEKFGSGTALMATLRLIHVEDECVRNLKDKYMILPIAKLDETQTAYYSYQHDSFTGIAIPSTVPTTRHEMLGAVLEVMASESYRTVTPAYYETALKARYMDDPVSWDMLDMITANIKLDAGVLYTKSLDNIHQKLRTVINNDKENRVSSRFNESTAETVRSKLNTMQDEIKKLQKLN